MPSRSPERFYSHTRVDNWFCSHCGQKSGQYGHYGPPNGKPKCPTTVNPDHGWGFACPDGHTCQQLARGRVAVIR